MKDIVYVVDDDEILRKLLVLLLTNAGFDAVEFASAEEFLDYSIKYTASCILLDVNMGGMSGLELQKQLKQREFVPPIIFMTSCSDIKQAVYALRAGAFHYLTKPIDDGNVIKAVAEAILASEEDAEFYAFLQKLTETEGKVARLIRQGLISKQVAEELGVSTRTVEWHRKNIADKGFIPTLHNPSKNNFHPIK